VQDTPHPENTVTAVQQETTNNDLHEWERYSKLASIIESSVPWTSIGPTSKRQWEAVLRAALALQKAAPEDVEVALLVYMCKAADGRSDPIARADSWSRPMLMLRVMFDIPESGPGSLPVPRNAVGICGGLPYERPTEPLQPSLSWPIRWTPSGPELVVFRSDKSRGKRGHPTSYQPHLEYRYFRSHFPPREGLQTLIDIEIQTWADHRPVR
jgi:hypothetical protein